MEDQFRPLRNGLQGKVYVVRNLDTAARAYFGRLPKIFLPREAYSNYRTCVNN